MADAIKNVERLPIDSRMSCIIESLRLPLAILVVFIHSFGGGYVTSIAVDGLDVRLYDVLRVGISHGIANVAVPCFFVISGYLFYSYTTFSKSDYFNKLKKRAKTLLIPYLFWNLVPILYSLCKRICGAIVKRDTTNLVNYVSQLNPFFIFWGEDGNAATIDIYGNAMPLALPINYPLWYLRDLIILVILSPIIFYIINSRLHVPFIIVLGVCFIFGLWPINYWFSISGVFFFTLGVWIRLYNIDIISNLLRFRILILLASFLLYAVLIVNNGSRLNNMIILLGMCSAFILFSNSSIKRHKLAKSSFFVFLTHMLFISLFNIHDTVFKPLLRRFGDGDLIMCIDYLAGTLIVVILCVTLQWIMKTVMPKVYRFSTGSR